MDPLFPPPHNQGDAEVFLNQVNEEEEDNLPVQDGLVGEQDVDVLVEVPQVIEVNIPVVNAPENFLPLEIQEEDLMEEEEIQQQVEEENLQGAAFGPQNLNVGFILTHF